MASTTFYNPAFIEPVLGAVPHRIIYILECESDHHPSLTDISLPPRFGVVSEGFHIDPRIVTTSHLIELDSELRLEGYEQLHQFIFVLSESSDSDGWEYNAVWNSSNSWSRLRKQDHHVRRRVWMAVFCQREFVLQAKSLLSGAVLDGTVGLSMHGNLYVWTEGSEGKGKRWYLRAVSLQKNKLRIGGIMGIADDGNSRGIILSQYEIKMMNNCPGQPFAFMLRSLRSDVKLLFAAEAKEDRRRWVVALCYQNAIYWPDLNFEWFTFGPPVTDTTSQVLMSGMLMKRGYIVKSWKMRYIRLLSGQLQYFDGEEKKGEIGIDGASIDFSEGSLEFDVSATWIRGQALTLRAENDEELKIWIKAIKRAIGNIQDKREADIFPNEVDIQELQSLAALSTMGVAVSTTASR